MTDYAPSPAPTELALEHVQSHEVLGSAMRRLRTGCEAIALAAEGAIIEPARGRSATATAMGGATGVRKSTAVAQAVHGPTNEPEVFVGLYRLCMALIAFEPVRHLQTAAAYTEVCTHAQFTIAPSQFASCRYITLCSCLIRVLGRDPTPLRRRCKGRWRCVLQVQRATQLPRCFVVVLLLYGTSLALRAK